MYSTVATIFVMALFCVGCTVATIVMALFSVGCTVATIFDMAGCTVATIFVMTSCAVATIFIMTGCTVIFRKMVGWHAVKRRIDNSGAFWTYFSLPGALKRYPANRVAHGSASSGVQRYFSRYFSEYKHLFPTVASFRSYGTK